MRAYLAVMTLLMSSPPPGLMRPSIMGIEPLRTNVAEADRILGIAPRAKESDGGDSGPVVMCYSSIARDVFLLVQSDAAGGYGNVVTGFVLTEREPKLRPVTSRVVGSNLCRESALVSRLGRYANRVKEFVAIDAGLQPTLDLLNSALAQLNEANDELRHYAERVHFEPGALEQLEDRLAEIHRLKRKYNGNVDEILQMQAQAEAELRSLDRGEEEIPGLERAFEAVGHVAWEAAGALSLERERVAKRFKRELEKEVKTLGMPGTVVEVRFLDLVEKEHEQPFVLSRKRITEAGIDQVEFYFSPNPGEPPKALAKIASGGELSRLMLAIKSLVLTPGDIPTLLFDEVDAGIGGGVAEIVGNKLKQVAANHQVICVTHLPQIAALADSHHVVRKEVARGQTSARVQKLKEKERVEEVARMLGGITITEKTRRHAAEMVKGQN